MTKLLKNNFQGLKTDLRRSTMLSSFALASGLLSVIAAINDANAGSCSGTGADEANTYTCSGDFSGSAYQQYKLNGNYASVPAGTGNQFWFKSIVSSTTTVTTVAGGNDQPIGIKLYSANGPNYDPTYINFINNGSITTSAPTQSTSSGGIIGAAAELDTSAGIYAINNGNINITTGDVDSSATSFFNYAQGFVSANLVNQIFSSPNIPTIQLINAGTMTMTAGNATQAAFTQSWAVGLEGFTKQYNSSGYTNNVNVELSNSGTITATSGNSTNSNMISTNQANTMAFGIFGDSIRGTTSITNTGTISLTTGNASSYTASAAAFGLVGLAESVVTAHTYDDIVLMNGSNGTIRVRTGVVTSTDTTTGNVGIGMLASPLDGWGGGQPENYVNKNITNNGTIDVLSGGGNAISSANGIVAAGNAGKVVITNSGLITTNGSTDAATYQYLFDNGTFNIRSPATPHPAGIYASTENNIINITNTSTGNINSYTESAISVRNFNSSDPNNPNTACPVEGCSVSITNDGVLKGLGTSKQTATISIDPNGKGNSAVTTITNNGTITTQSGSLDSYAIAVGSPVNTTLRVINNGTIIGKWEQYQNGAAVTNNYVWDTTGTNNFKGGGNSITNSAGALIQSQGDTIFVMDGTDNSITNAGTIRTIGGKLTLDPPNNTVTVYNSGLIDMANDGSNSVANVVQIDGNFVASGNSAVAVNTQLGGAGSQSDRLLIVGNASGTNTSLIIRDTKGGVGAYNPFGTAIVGYGGTSTGGFTLSAQSDHFAFRNGMSTLNKGLYFYYIGQGTGSTGCDAGYTCYSLYSAPSTAAKSLPIAVTAAQSLWQETALMWEDRQVELRDELTTRAYAAGNDPSVSRNNVRYNTALKPQDGGISTWIKSVGAWTNRSNYQTQWGGGGTALSYDLSYRQNSLGMLGGADWSKAGFLTPKDYLVVGVMGGYLNSSVNFNQEAGNVLGQENFTYQGGTVGGSISYMLNGFFADALFKNDMLRSNMRIPVIGLTGSSTGVNTAGGVGNLGYRLNYGSMFFEPMATLTYSNTYMGGLNDLGAQGVNVSFGPGNDFRGGFGGRVGSNFGNIISNHMLELSLTGRYWNMFNSNAGRTATIVSDFTPDTIGDYTLGRDYGEIKGNVNVFSLGSGMSAFINTGVRFNDHFQTVITKGGLAYRF